MPHFSSIVMYYYSNYYKTIFILDAIILFLIIIVLRDYKIMAVIWYYSGIDHSRSVKHDWA